MTRRRSKSKDFYIQRAEAKFGDKYSFSIKEEDIVSGESIMTVVCSKHGESEKTIRSMYNNKYCCPQCNPLSSSSREFFLQKSDEVHGGKYDYSKVEFHSLNKKVEIICKEHGSFFQLPSRHIEGVGCRSCAAGRKRHTHAKFVRLANIKHGNKYDYSRAKYVSGKSEVEIVCPTHGVFIKKAHLHLEGKGCIECNKAERRAKLKDYTEEFVKKAKAVHGDKYGYNKTVYQGSNKELEIICKTHGSFFSSAANHLAGTGCRQCKIDSTRLNEETLLERLIEKHGDSYSFKIKGKHERTSDTKINITCSKHGELTNSYRYLISHSFCCEKCKAEKKMVKTKEKKRLKKKRILVDNCKKKENGEKLLQKFKDSYMKKYSFSLQEKYKTLATARIVVGCPLHGESIVRASRLKAEKSCCEECSKIDREIAFKKTSREIHTKRYDYSKVLYESSTKEVEIICKEHGSFFRTPFSHLRGSGCPKCSLGKLINKTPLINELKSRFGKNYSFRIEEKQKRMSHIVVEVSCLKHGKSHRPYLSLQAAIFACSECYKESRVEKDSNPKRTFIKKSMKAYKSKYDYSKVVYIEPHKKVEIICLKHGSFFRTPSQHLSGKECQKCSYFEDFLRKVKHKHGDTYNYSKVEYSGSQGEVEIVCPFHGSFHIVADRHLSGKGCDKCVTDKRKEI